MEPERVEVGEHLVDRALPPTRLRGQVVARDQLAVGLDPGDQLVQLQGQQPPVGAQLDDVPLDLAGDAAHHLQPLGHRGDVADRDQILDLEGGQRARDLVEAHLVALERRQGLVGLRQDGRRVLEDVAAAGDVQRDDPHRLADRDHRVAGLLGDPFRRAVPGAGLLGGDARSPGPAGRCSAGCGWRRGPGSPRRPSSPARGARSRRSPRRGRTRRCTSARRPCRSRGRPARRCVRAGSARARPAWRCRARRRRGWTGAAPRPSRPCRAARSVTPVSSRHAEDRRSPRV